MAEKWFRAHCRLHGHNCSLAQEIMGDLRFRKTRSKMRRAARKRELKAYMEDLDALE